MNLLNGSIRKWVIAATLLIALLSPSLSFAAEESDIQSYVNDMQPGWNLGNSFDALGTDETAWGNPRVTKELIEQVAAQGYKSIRIPVTFDERMEGGPDYTIDSDFLDRVEQAVEWSLEEDMYVMINIHHDSWVWLEEGMHENHDESLARYNAIWTQLSEHFKDYSHKLMFESINEPRFWGSDDDKNKYLYELNTSFYEIVRQSGGNNDVRPLVLPTLDTGSEPEKLDVLYDTIVELDDPNLISTVHYYGFWPFSVNIAGNTRFDEETKNDIIDTFDRVYDKFTANGIPVIIGEFGLLGFDTDINTVQQGEKLKFFEYVIHYANEKQMTHMLWDNGQHFGRTSLDWYDNELYNMMKASWEGRSATADSDFIYLKQDEDINDMEIGLDLHGNDLVALQVNDQDLVVGQDYELNGDTLVVKSNLLSSLTPSRELGKNAELTAKFNQGVDWRIDVITYNTSILDHAEGTTSDFSIPIQFNGNQLATMEAVYDEVDSDGDPVPAGPQNWTSFKEFAYTFSPVYADNEIVIKENFFNEIDDGKEVHLTFHFWSGDTLAYTVTKNGNHVVGVHKEDPVLADVSGLVSLIETAEAISNEENKYTEESFKALQEAIANAKSVLETIDTEEDVEKEITTLQLAIDGLKKEPVDPPTPTDPEEPTEPSKPEKKDKVVSTPVITNGKATISSEDIGKLAENGQFIIQISAEENVDEVLLTAEQISELVKKKADILVEKSGIHMTIPSANFNEGDLAIKVEKLSPNDITVPKGKKLISDIYDITIIQDGKVISEFTSGDPLTLSFPIDKSAVKITENLGVFYLDPESEQWVDIGGEYLNGFVTVTTEHLGIFALMEVIETQVIEDEKDTTDNDVPKKEVIEDSPKQDGETLPKTATSMYTILLTGLVLLVIGTISLLVMKRRRVE